ncbi:TM2 domain-containing protein [Mycolicibacterium farcinogenes]|nr:TM2 domain-containing protein [Mycolicibacterium farcinogenes]
MLAPWALWSVTSFVPACRCPRTGARCFRESRGRNVDAKSAGGHVRDASPGSASAGSASPRSAAAGNAAARGSVVRRLPAPGPPAGYPPQGPPQGYPPQAPPPGYPGQPQPGYAGQPQAYGAYGADPSAPFGRDPLTGEPLSDKSAITAGLLQFFLGAFGVGRFYIGSTNIGAIQLGLTIVGILTSILFVGLFLVAGVGIWALVDSVMMFTRSVPDKYGRKLRS